MNSLIRKWKKENQNVSIEICEAVLLKDKMENSVVLLQILKTVELVEQLLKIKKIDVTLDDILMQLISVNTENLSEIFNDTTIVKKKVIPKKIDKKEAKPTKVEKIPEETMEENNELEIPIDYLTNL